MSSSKLDLFTCVTCNVAFNDAEVQRAHYKTDWHRYNLKRKVAELPAVNAKDFEERVQLQKTQQENAESKGSEEMFCKLCSKHFSNENSFINHKQSKKHKDLESAILSTSQATSRQIISGDKTDEISTSSQSRTSETSSQIDDLIAVKSDRAEKKAVQLEQFLKKQEQLAAAEEEQEEVEAVVADENDENEQDWEDIEEDEEDIKSIDESKGIPLNVCLFCTHKSDSVEDKCEHMAKVHSFFIPDSEHVSDLEGLIKFLGIKLGVYHVCLWCSNKCYRDLLSVQKHMADKGHHKLKFEGQTLIEYADFYSYDDEDESTIDDEYDMLSSDLEATVSTVALSNQTNQTSIFEDENYELVLPSGAKIGHRSLFRYYKQSFGHRNMELKQRNNLTLKDKYKAIASNGAYNAVEIQKQRKDLAYFQRWQAKMHAKLGWKANKLQQHIRRQDITF